MTEVKHDLGQLPDTFLHGHELPVDHVDAVGGRIDHVLLDEASETGEVGGDGGNAHDGTLGRGVAPRFVIGRKHAHVAASDKLFIVEADQRIVTVQKIWMKDDLDSILWIIEQVASLQ